MVQTSALKLPQGYSLMRRVFRRPRVSGDNSTPCVATATPKGFAASHFELLGSYILS